MAWPGSDVTPAGSVPAPSQGAVAARGGDDPDDIPLLNVRFLWRLVYKRRYLIALVILVVEALAAIMVFRSPKLYPARAKLIIQDDVNRMLGGQDPLGSYLYSEEFFQTQYRRLNSRTVIERAVHDAKIDQWPEYRDVPDLPAVVAGSIDLTPVHDSRMVEMLYEGPDPKHAVELVNAVIKAFEEEFHETRRSEAAGKVSSLGGTIDQIEADMRHYEELLQQHMQKHNIVSTRPEFNAAYLQLQEVARREAKLEADFIEMDARMREIQKPDHNALGVMGQEGVAEMGRLWVYDQQLAQLELERVEKEKLFGPESGEYKTVNEAIAAVEGRRREVGRQLISSLEKQFARLKEALTKIRARKIELEEEVGRINERLVEYERLKSRLKQSQDQFQEVLTGASRSEAYGAIRMNPILVVERPVETSVPSQPRVTKSLSLGFIMGFVLGLGLAILFEFLDDSLRTAQDLENYVGVPCMAIVPRMSQVPSEAERAAVSWTHQKEAMSEAFRTMRATMDLQTMPHAGGSRVIMITSSQPNEGKTTVTSNLAITHALNGRKVLLIDGDLRKTSDLTQLGVPADAKGLSEFLAGQATRDEALTGSKIKDLDIIGSGSVRENPSELLGHKRMTELIDWARDRYEVVVIDSPPLLAVSDGLVMSPLADFAVLVVHGGQTSRGQVAQAMQVLQQSRIHVVGAVLNDLSGRIDRHQNYYGYGSYYHYGSEGNSKSVALAGETRSSA